MCFNRKNAEQKNWRMIKKGKHFLFGCSLVFAVGATLATPTVHADSVEAKTEATNSATQNEPTAEATTYAAPAATSPVATEAVEANSATTVVSADKSQLEAVLTQAKAKNLDAQEASVKAEVASAIAEAEALVANGSASQEQVNQSVERLTQAVASVKEVTEAAIEKTSEATTESSATPKVRSRRATTEGTTRSIDETNLARAIVTKENFESFFQEGGTASYEKSSGTIKLTEDVSGQAGNAYLRFKIDPSQDFSFTGKVDIGNKYEGHEVDGRAGGDGVGFVFHTGKQSQLGLSGASIGMGGINAAFGFKLDSWWNKGTPKPEIKSMADPSYNRGDTNHAFGAFYSSNNQGRVNSITEMKPLNPAPNGQWVDFKINYNYNGTKKEFTVTYGSQTWTTKLDKSSRSMTNEAKNALTARNATYALSFVGSTGSGTNLQRVQIEKFEFTAPQIVHMKFVDAKGNEIEASSAIPGDENEVINLSTQDSKIAAVEAKGYKLKRIDASKAPSYNEGNNTVTLTPGGQLLTYVFAPAGPTVTPTLQVGGVMTEPGIKSTDNTISGIGKKGATIKIAVAGKTIVDNVTVAEDGSWSATLPTGVNSNITEQDQLVPRDTLTVTQTINGEESAETEVKVGLGESVVQPSETSSDKQSIVAETTTVTLKVPHDAGIAYFDYPKAGNARSVVAIKRDSIPGAWTSKDESKAVVKSYSTDGFFDTIVLEMKEQIQPGKAKVVSNIKEDKYTSPVGWKEINVEAKPADTTPPAAPKVNPVTAASTAVTGTAEPGSTVEVTLPNGSTVSAKADQDGNFSVPVSGLEEGKTVSVTATDAAGNKSGATSVTVPDTTAPAAPTVNPVKAGATAITGTAEAGSTVEVTLPNGQKASAKAGDNGEFSIPVPALNADDKISVTATDVAKNTSTPTKVTVKETVRPVVNIPYDDKANQIIYVYSGEENNIELKITDNSGKIAKAYLVFAQDNRTGLGTEDAGYLNGKTKSALYLKANRFGSETTATETNPAIIKLTANIPNGSYTDGTGITRYVYAEDLAGNTNYDNVGAAGDTGAPGRIRFVWKPQTFKYTAVAPSTPITSNTVPEASAIEKAVKDANPTFSDKIDSVTLNGTNVTVTYKDGSTDVIPANSVFTIEPTAPTVTPVKNPSSLTQPEKDAVKKAVETANKTATKVEVGNDGTTTLTYSNGSTAKLTPAQTVSQADVTAPDAPVVNPVKAGDKAVTGTAEAGSTVEVTLPDGTKATATADKDGNFSVPVSGLEEGQTVSVTAKDASNNTSTPTTATVAKADDKTAPDAPVVNPVKAGDEAITGKAEPGSTVEVTLPGGAKKSATAGEDGTFSIPVSGLNENDEVSVTATDAAKNTSTPTTATVAKADDKTAPDAPVVNPVKAGDEAITGKAEPGSTVEVTLPGGAKKSATAGEDGTFSIPVSGLNENDEVSVTATDAAKNTSTPTTATVAKADDKTAPDAPVVNPVKAGDEAITGKAEPGSTVEVTLPGGAKKSATAGEDGTFSIPVSGLNENDEVSVTATDAAKNTSTPTTATVAKADDKTAPDAPVVNPVKAGDEAITGKAEPGSTVEVTLPGGAKKSATAGEDGTFSIPVSGLNENDEVSVTATDAAKNTSTPTTATVAKADDKTAPDAPVVNPVKAGDEAITGKAEPGSTVEVTLPGGAKKSATAGEDGTFSIPVSGLNENDEVSVTATDAAKNTSTPTTATVAKADDKTAPDAPVVNPVKAGDEAITGKAEPGSTVEVTLPGGAKKSATAGEDGTFSIPVSGLNENDEVSVTATDAAKNTSTPTTATVAKADDKTAPDAPVVNPVKAGDEAITGKAEPGSTVEVTLPGGAKKSATAGEDGTFSIPVSGLNENDEVSVTATDAAKNTSTPTTATVAKADDKTAPDAPVVNPVKAGDEAITGKAEPGSTVEVTLPGGAKKSATAGEDGTFSIPVSGLNENDEVSVTATDAAKNTSTPTTATVAKADDKTAPDAPVVNPVKAGDEAITGKAEPGSTVEVTLPGGAKKSATAGEDGTFSIPVSGLNENDEVSVTATDAAKNTSTPTTATVAKADDKTAPDAPVVNPVKAGDEAITGKAEPGSTVEVTLPGGAKKSATAGEDGTFSIPVSGLNENDEVSVTATDAAKNTSTPTTATVAKADDKTAPDAPVVNPVKAGDEAITGKAEPGSTVEVTLPGGAKKSATAGEDGTFSIPVSGLNENDEVSVTATDAAKNTSTPTTATVAKADDKTAPDAPVVNPVKAGDEAITGKAEPGSTVEVTLPGGAKKSATAGEDGTFSIPVSGLNENDEVSVTATDAAKNTSTPTTATVAKADDKTAPDAPVVNPVKAGDEAITGKAEPGSTVEVTLPGGAKKSATAGEDGTFSIPVSGLNENDEVSVTATDAAKNTSTPTTATVAKADDKTAPDAPVVNPVKAGDEAITGKAEPGSTVEVTLPGGAKKSATAGEDGTFSIPVSGLNENDEVSVTATDAAKNTSTPTTATVAKADDKTAPDAPVVNPVKAGDEAITGKAEPGSTVEVTLPGGAKKSATAGEDGTFSIPVSGLNENDEVSVTATDAAKNTSTPTTATVAKADDKTAPDAPVVNPVKAGDEAITGKAEPGSTVEVTLPGGAKKSATAGEDGTFSIPVSGLNENDEVSVTATDAAKNTSTPTTATVAKADDKTAPDAPVVNPVKAGDTAVTGTAEAGSTVEVTLPDGTKATATADQDGNFSVPVSGLEEGQTVSVTATDAAKNTSTPTTATVAKADDKTAPDAPVVNPVKAGDTAVTGTAEAGSTVEVTLPDGTKATATADQDGNFSVPVSGLEEGQTVSVTATDAAKNTSTPTTATVAKADDKTAPDAPVVNPVKAGDEAITGKAEPGSTVEVTLPGGAKKSATAGEDGTFSIPVSGLNENDEVSVTATDAAKNTSTPTTATVAKADDKTAPDAPVVNPVKAGDEAITGKAEPGSTVEVTLPGGAKKSATAGEDGTFSIPVSGLNENDEVSVTATDAAKNTSTPTTATVAKADDKTAPDAPVVNPVKAGDEAITGKAEPGSTVEVTLPGGAKKSATAGEDGTFSIPVSGLNENDEVSVTATDAAKNTSTPTTATVAKADDKTAPDAPVVNPVKAGDEAITGKAEPGSTVEVTLPGGAKKSATAGEDGTFSIPVSGLNENDEVSVTATDAAKNTSTPTTATVAKADDKTAPDAPVVNPVKAGDEAITGKAEPGSTVEVTLPGGAKKSATAGEDGTFSIPVSGLNENDEVSVTATDAAKNTSTPTTATVAKADDKTAPDAPVVNPVKAGDEAITGKAEPGSTVEVTLPGGAKKSATAGEDGTFSIPVSGLNENDEVSVTATDAAKNTSTPTTATVAKADDKTAPDAPVVNPVKAGDEAITGKAEPGSTVEVTLPGGAKKSATAGEDGTFSIPVSGLNENDEVSVTATDAAKNTSTPTTATVAKADDKTAPDAPVVNPVKAGDEAITGKAEPGSTVEVTLPGGAKKSATAGEDGTFSIPVSGLNENDEVSVTATDAAKNTSTPTTATVAKADDKTAPDAPVVNPVKAGDEAITGKAEPGSTVEVTLPGGAKKSATAGEDGTFSIPVSGLNENDEVSVTATDAAKNTSTPTTATVAKADDKTAPDAPVVNPVKAGDTAVTGTAEAGSTVEVTLPDGTKATATADQDGNFSVPVSGLEEGQTVSVTATDAAKNTSTPTTATVAKADDKTAPDAPVVNPVKAGDTAVTGTAEAGSTVEVTLPDGTKATATADQDGNFSVPVSGLEEGQTVSVTATDAAKNTSTPTTATVAKADDKTAPDAPVVNPVKAGDEAITGKAEPGSTVEVTLPGGAKKSATAGEDGTFSIPVSGLNENDEVSVTATDAAKNTSTPTTATVAKADDKTAPDAPVVNPVKAGDEAITGKAEPGSTVEVTLPGGAKKSATAGEDGTFSIPVSGLNENDEVSVTATDAAKNTSTPTTATVAKADDKTAPDAPVVNPVKAGDEAITGKAEPGSTVEVTLPGGAKKSATAGEDGTFSIPVSGLNENDEVSVTATDAAKNTSTPTTATVAKADDKTAPDAPVVNPVKAGDEAITGKAEPGSTVEVTLPGGAKKSATAGEDGTFSIPVSGLNENDEVSVTATDAAKNTSTPTTATVAKADDKTAPDAPVVNPVKAGDEAITGKAEPGSTVEVTLPGGAKKSATAGEDGTFSIPVSGLNENDEVSVTATDAAKNTSTPTTATVAKADDKTAPDAPVVNPVKAGDEAITGKAEPGSTVEVTLPGGAKKSATAGEDGTFSIPVSGLNENDEVSVTATDAAKNTSTPTTATVAKADDKTAPDAPVVNPVKAGDEAITGKAEPGSTVEVTLPGGAKKSATAGEDGTFSIPVSGLNENDEVSVTATDAAKNTSTPTTATVAKADDKTAPDAPVVNPVKAGDEAITGKAEPGSTVEVTLPGGAKKSATAGEDGTFSIPVSGLNENDEVSVTATDAAKNTSTPTTATVAKADDKTAPDAPVVNPVKAGDEAITGKAEPGSTVEVTLPGGAKKSATAGEDGTFSIPVSGLNENDEVSVTATDAAKNTSTPTTATVAKADDKTAPDAPVVNPVKAGDEAITGKAEPGSTVEVTLPGGAKKSATAGEDGTFSIPVSGLNENDEVSVTATDAAKNTSTPTTATVAKADDKTAPDAPVVNPVKAGDEAITGKAEPGSTVEVTLPGGAKKSATAGEDGTFSIPVSGLNENDEVSVTATDAAKNTSTPTTATVAKADDKTAPDAPVVNPVKAGDEAITGKAEPGSTVEVTLPGGAKKSATAGEDGTFSIPVSGLNENDEVSVTATDAAKNTSTPTTATVAKADDKTAPDAPVVNPVKAGDTAVTGTAEAGSTVEVTLPDGTKATATADQDGNFSVPVSGLEEGQTVSVTATDAAKNTSTPTTATVAKADDKTAPDAPVVNPVKAGDTAVTGTAEAGSTVEVTLPDGTKATATADQDGNFSVPVSGLEEGQTVSVTATDAAKNTSTPTTATVAKADDKTAPDAPVVNPVKAGDTAVTGTAEAGSTVEVTLPDGTKATATADQDGNFSVPVSGLEEGQTVSVTATDAAKNTSTPTTATVAKADDKTAPDAPVVNPVKAGDEAITGKAEPGSTVEVTLPGGAKKSATAGEDGTFSIPVSGLKAGDKVTAVAKDASGNTSTPTEKTVGKGDGKDADNVKVPALTPVVDPNNLTDAEKAKVADEVKKANPTATDVEVNNDGTVVVTFADGSVAVLASEKVVKEATKESPAQEPSKKAGAKELPNTGTKQSSASLALALLAAATGGLLISKKRKEEE